MREPAGSDHAPGGRLLLAQARVAADSSALSWPARRAWTRRAVTRGRRDGARVGIGCWRAERPRRHARLGFAGLRDLFEDLGGEVRDDPPPAG
jgi:hypothetical protein